MNPSRSAPRRGWDSARLRFALSRSAARRGWDSARLRFALSRSAARAGRASEGLGDLQPLLGVNAVGDEAQ
ncbi:MAG: hypothetical protein QNL98_01145, partial [Mycobacterium sp.]